MKVAQTRLVTRVTRPGVEACKDSVQYKYVRYTSHDWHTFVLLVFFLFFMFLFVPCVMILYFLFYASVSSLAMHVGSVLLNDRRVSQ